MGAKFTAIVSVWDTGLIGTILRLHVTVVQVALFLFNTCLLLCRKSEAKSGKWDLRVLMRMNVCQNHMCS